MTTCAERLAVLEISLRLKEAIDSTLGHWFGQQAVHDLAKLLFSSIPIPAFRDLNPVEFGME